MQMLKCTTMDAYKHAGSSQPRKCWLAYGFADDQHSLAPMPTLRARVVKWQNFDQSNTRHWAGKASHSRMSAVTQIGRSGSTLLRCAALCALPDENSAPSLLPLEERLRVLARILIAGVARAHGHTGASRKGGWKLEQATSSSSIQTDELQQFGKTV